MNLKELKQILNNLGPEFDDCKIMLQKDAEGNGFGSLYDVDSNCIYHNDQIFNREWSADDYCMEEEEWEEIKTLPPCILLAP